MFFEASHRGLQQVASKGVEDNIHSLSISPLQDIKLKASITGVCKVLILQL